MGIFIEYYNYNFPSEGLQVKIYETSNFMKIKTVEFQSKFRIPPILKYIDWIRLYVDMNKFA